MIDLPPTIEFMPGTTEPAPSLMTAEEAVRYLRLDVGRGLPAALKALQRLVERMKIRPCRVGKHRRYSRHELDRFIADETNKHGEAA